jgi:hypothetical protein
MYSPCLLTYFHDLCLFDFRNIGAKLEHFKKLQGNLEFYQNKCHPGGVPNMRRQCAKAADQWAQGVAGRPNPLACQPHLTTTHGLATR